MTRNLAEHFGDAFNPLDTGFIFQLTGNFLEALRNNGWMEFSGYTFTHIKTKHGRGLHSPEWFFLILNLDSQMSNSPLAFGYQEFRALISLRKTSTMAAIWVRFLVNSWRQWRASVNYPSLVQIMSCLFSTKPLSEPMMPYSWIDPKEHISVKFRLTLVSIQQNTLENLAFDHFVSASMLILEMSVVLHEDWTL